MKRAWKSLTIAIGASAILLAMFAVVPAYATFHLWKFDEVFSNADGSVQFIEMTNAFDLEQFVSGHPLTSTTHTVTPSTNLPAINNMTAGHHMLFATAGFGALAGGVTPDYLIPANFFNPAGDTLNWAGGFDIETFGAIPTDGVHSLILPGMSTAVNSPTNFAGDAGSVNLAPPSPTGDYNHNNVVDAADYTVWRDTFGQMVKAGQGADGNADGIIDNGDYDFWKSKFGAILPGSGSGAGQAAAPEPSTLILVFAAAACVAVVRWRQVGAIRSTGQVQ
jgi:serralysin